MEFQIKWNFYDSQDLKYRRPSLFAVFLYAVLLIRGPKVAFLGELILKFEPYISLFIRGFVIRGPIFQERIYRE